MPVNKGLNGYEFDHRVIDIATAVEGDVEGVEEDDNPVLVVMEL